MTSANSATTRLAYYTAANASHYPGLIALLNSIRLVGERAPIFVVDCGFTERQRQALSPHVTLVPAQNDLHPTLQKATAPLAYKAQCMVLLDADIIVTRSLEPLVETANSGSVVTFVDSTEPHRFFSEWSVLGLGNPRRQPYVNAGNLILSSSTASELLPLLVDLQTRLDIENSFVGTGGDSSNPFFYADQDVLNALLMTSFEGRVSRLEGRLAPHPPFAGLRVVDAETLSCRYADGTAPYLLHHVAYKPWLMQLKPTPYSELFLRALNGSQIPLRIADDELPLRFRSGLLGAVERRRLEIRYAATTRLRRQLQPRPRLERFVDKTILRRT